MGATIAALGAALVWGNPDSAPQEPSAPLALAAGSPAEQAAQVAQAESAVAAEAPVPGGAKGSKPPPVAGPRPAPRSIAATPGAAADAPVVSVCNNCGVVEAVDAVKRQGEGSGVGAVAGGVVGGAIGNRMGTGSGKTAMTVLGAIGGGLAGNAIEKRVKAETVYRVKVRMTDGSLRTVTRSQSVAVGAHVTVDGQALKLTSPPTAGSHPA